MTTRRRVAAILERHSEINAEGRVRSAETGERRQRLARVFFLLVMIFYLPTTQTCQAEKAPDPYDSLYDVIMTRHGPDGAAYGRNEVTPLLYSVSDFPFGKTYEKFMEALDDFHALPQEKIEAYGVVKRALLQRHLWAVFDASTASRVLVRQSHEANRKESQHKIASVIRRLALTKTEILALPDTMAATVELGGFPQQYDSTDHFKPFLPPDLFGDDSPWVCMRRVNNPVAFFHGDFNSWRSAFLQFVRVPGGRHATLDYLEKLNAREVFPVGTQFALIEQAFLISDEGEQILSPLINNVQLRAYLIVDKNHREALPDATQCVTEFIMQPRQLMRRNAVMKAIDRKDVRYKTFGQDGGKLDPFELDDIGEHGPRLRECKGCHGGAGIKSLGDMIIGGSRIRSRSFQEGNPVDIGKATAARKREDNTWRTLWALWQTTEQRGNDVPRVDAKSSVELVGRIVFDGDVPSQKKITDSYAAAEQILRDTPIDLRDQSLVVGKGKGIANVFVYVRSTDIPFVKPKAGQEVQRIRTTKGQFTPHVRMIQTGQQLEVENTLAFPVNFHSRFWVNDDFNILIPAGVKRRFQLMAESVPVRYSCDIYPWMHGWLLIKDHPYMAITDSSGKFEIDGLPVGEWEFQIWHERVGNLATADWPKGRFKLRVRDGTNDLGTIKIKSDQFTKQAANQRGSNLQLRRDRDVALRF